MREDIAQEWWLKCVLFLSTSFFCAVVNLIRVTGTVIVVMKFVFVSRSASLFPINLVYYNLVTLHFRNSCYYHTPHTYYTHFSGDRERERDAALPPCERCLFLLSRCTNHLCHYLHTFTAYMLSPENNLIILLVFLQRVHAGSINQEITT